MQKKTINKSYFLIGLILILGILIISTISLINPVNPKTVFAENDYTLNYTYSSDIQAYTVTGYTGTPINVVIPETYNDGTNGEFPVVSIGADAFKSCSSLLTIVIPNSVTNIGEYAFKSCSSLLTIVIPNSVTNIGKYAFFVCESLTSITISENVTSIGSFAFDFCRSLTSIIIPASVTSIGRLAFKDCSKLKYIDVSSDNNFYSSDEGVLFNKNKTTLIRYPQGKIINDYNIPVYVENIGESAFDTCNNLSSVTITKNVKIVENWAFAYCDNLTSIIFEEQSEIITIGSFAFNLCRSLTSINIPNSVTNIGESAFDSCRSLSSVVFEQGIQLTSIGDSAFKSCSNLTSITIPASVTSIENSAFEHCSKLSSVIFEDNSQLITIGIWGFFGCLALQNITVPSNVINIGDSAFGYCSSLISIILQNNVAKIGFFAFSNCSSLTSIIIPESVKNIYGGAFNDCTNLTCITLKAISPPSLNSAINNAIFTNSGITLTTGVIYVPAGSLAEYRSSGYSSWSWSSYKNIIFAEPGQLVPVKINTSDIEIFGSEEVEITVGEEFEDLEEFREDNLDIREGYTFSEWKYNGETVTESTIFNYEEEIILVPIFDANTYTVTFKLYEGEEEYFGEGIELTYDSLIDYLPENPTREGYNFIGWYFGDTKIEVGGTYTIANDTTVVGKWTINQYTISFNSNGGSSVMHITQDYGTEVLEPNAPNKIGYAFIGWFTDNETFQNEYEFTTMPAENIVLYAKWEIIKLDVSYLDYENLEVISTQKINYGSNLIRPTVPVREGFDFDGWYTDKTYSQTFVFGNAITQDITIYAKFTKIVKVNIEDSEIEETLTVGKEFEDLENLRQDNIDSKPGYTLVGWTYNDEIVTEETVFDYDENITIKAIFDPNTYTVTFDINYDGENYPDSITLTYDNIIEMLPRPTREGYVFKGWYIGNTRIEEGQIYNISNDSVLTARWEEIGYDYTWIYIVSPIILVSSLAITFLLIKLIKRKKFSKV